MKRLCVYVCVCVCFYRDVVDLTGQHGVTDKARASNIMKRVSAMNTKYSNDTFTY